MQNQRRKSLIKGSLKSCDSLIGKKKRVTWDNDKLQKIMELHKANDLTNPIKANLMRQLTQSVMQKDTKKSKDKLAI